MTNEDKRRHLQKTWTRWRGMEGVRKKERRESRESGEEEEEEVREGGRTTRERNFPRVKQSKIPPKKTRKDTASAKGREGTFALPGTPVSGRRCRVDGEQGTAAASKQRWKPFRFRAKLYLIYSPFSM